MYGKNGFNVLGNLTRDPEIRQTPNGKKYCYLTVAENYAGKGGEKKVRFIPMIAWEKTAEIICEYLKKGSGVDVEGTIIPYERQNGDKKYTSLQLRAEKVIFLGSKAVEKIAPDIDEDMPIDDGDEVDVPF